jgi:hypothetical protein
VGALERARWAGARALCSVLRLRVLIARGGGYRWIRGSCYRASIFCQRSIRVCFLAVLLCERIVYVWLPYACVCAGEEGSCAVDCPIRVCFRVCVHAYARMRVRVLVPLVKCAHVYVFQYMRVEFCL